jgi:hypothetical protein
MYGLDGILRSHAHDVARLTEEERATGIRRRNIEAYNDEVSFRELESANEYLARELDALKSSVVKHLPIIQKMFCRYTSHRLDEAPLRKEDYDAAKDFIGYISFLNREVTAKNEAELRAALNGEST